MKRIQLFDGANIGLHHTDKWWGRTMEATASTLVPPHSNPIYHPIAFPLLPQIMIPIDMPIGARGASPRTKPPK